MIQLLQNLIRTKLFTKVPQAQFSPRYNFHKDYDASREEQTLQLADGRTLGFAEYGALNGIPTMFLHGTPGSRYDGADFLDIAKKLNVRLICPERPGYGLSTFKADQKLSEYPNDISQLAKHLAIPQYHLFGISGGGTFAIACGYKSPKDELLSAGVIAGMGHPATLTVKDDGWYTVTTLFMAKWTPNIMRAMINWSIKDEERFERTLRKAATYLTKEDQAIVLNPKTEKKSLAGLKEAYAQGPDGAIRDGQIYAGPWDFELGDVQRKVQLFYGLIDDRSPPAFGRYFKAHLPNAQLIEYKDMSHFTTHRDEEMISRIIGTWEEDV